MKFVHVILHYIPVVHMYEYNDAIGTMLSGTDLQWGKHSLCLLQKMYDILNKYTKPPIKVHIHTKPNAN